MIIKNTNKFDMFIKQEPLDRVRYKEITASLLFSHKQLEVIHYQLNRNSQFYLCPDEASMLPEFVYVLSGIIRKELEHIKDPQSVLYQAGEFISFDPVTKPVVLTAESEDAQLLYIYPAQVFNSFVAALANDLHNMASSVEFKMGLSSERIPRIRERAVQIGKHLHLDESQIQLIQYASQYQNIGKIMYTDDFLINHSSNELESEDWKKHPIYAKEILQDTEQTILKKTSLIVEQCFEFWNGSGYPYGLKEHDISIEASIISLSLHFEDALDQYENEESAIEFIRQGSGTLFRPEVVHAFIEIITKPGK